MSTGAQVLKFVIADFDQNWSRSVATEGFIIYTATASQSHLAVVHEGRRGALTTYRYRVPANEAAIAAGIAAAPGHLVLRDKHDCSCVDRTTRCRDAAAAFATDRCRRLCRHRLLARPAGDGFDLRVSRHIAIRQAQAEYFLTKFYDGNNNQQNNFRFSAGIVLRFD